MIISNSRKFIYIHLHKTAGTSIEKALDPCLRWDDIILGSTEYGEKIQHAYNKRFFLNKHSSAQECFDVVGKDTWESCYTFTTVRNPYSLVVSTYTYARKMLKKAIGKGRYSRDELLKMGAGNPELPKGLLSRVAGRMTGKRRLNYQILQWPIIKGLVESGHPEPSFDRYLQSVHTWNDLALRPQYGKLTISRNGDHLVDIDTIINMETLDAEWPVLCRRIGVDVKLPHANKSVKKKWQDYYTSGESIALVNERFAEDFEAFGYDLL